MGYFRISNSIALIIQSQSYYILGFNYLQCILFRDHLAYVGNE